MTGTHRPRRLAALALAGASALLALAACSAAEYPNSIFTSHTEFNRDVGHLFTASSSSATIVFVFVEALLLYAILRFRRRREGSPSRSTCTATRRSRSRGRSIPALILVVHRRPDGPDDLQDAGEGARRRAAGRGDRPPVVVGVPLPAVQRHRPTANELYLPIGRTVNFTLKSKDVIHSFWIPQLGGKRDVITNHTNYLWFTPDSSSDDGVERRVCRVLRREPREHALQGVHGDAGGVRELGRAPADAGGVRRRRRRPAPRRHAGADRGRHARPPPAAAAAAPRRARRPAAPARRRSPAPRRRAQRDAGVAQAGYAFPRDKMPAYAVPQTPIPAGLTFDDSRCTGDAAARRSSVARQRVHRLPHDPRQPDDGRARSARTSRTSASRTTIARRALSRTTRSTSRSGSRTRAR